MTITIRSLKSIEECRHSQVVEKMIWADSDEVLIPSHVLITVIKNGGGLLGAYADDGPAESDGMVGFALWWLGEGTPRGELTSRLKVCSHIVGVLPGWQGRRIGLQLKLAQRDAVLAQGLTDWVTWTYDPLYRANGVFNLHRLGATCNTYFRNVYGEMQDTLNKGMPSDRCQVDWRLNDLRVPRSPDDRPPQRAWDPAKMHILPAMRRADGFQEPVNVALPLDGSPLAVPIPDDIAAIRAQDGPLSLAWRFYLRNVFEEAFDAGYVMVDCVPLDGRGWFYVLTQS
jgi:predicted GNAT superfamily acetyltransferase